jgi:acetate kinase
VAGRLDWLGVALDGAANAEHSTLISAAASRVRLYVIPTDEERRIAEQTRRIAGESQGVKPLLT